MTVKKRVEKLEQATGADKTERYMVVGKNGTKIEMPSSKNVTVKVNIDLDEI